MKKIVSLIFVLSLISLVSFGQDKPIIEIEGQKISTDEFMYIYGKSGIENSPTDYNSLKEYLDLFITFKLKVHEAQLLGYDTLKSFKNELAGYRNQLSQPYLTDKKVEEDVLREAYDRMKYDVRVAHILVKSGAIDSPEDTLKAYDKINMIYDKLEKGEDFEKLSASYSDDEYFKNSGGDLGYYNVFSLVYEFETEMYNTPVGKFSKPFKTSYGYHILKVLDKRPAKGRYKIAHIMKVSPKDLSIAGNPAEDTIRMILQKIDNGENFEELANKYSDDRRTAESGGELGWVTVGGRMIREFEDAVFSLNEPGQLARWVKTSYGYHIVKLLEIEKIKPLEEIKHEIKEKVSNNARSSKSREAVIKRLKSEYNLTKYPENIDEMTKLFMDTVTYKDWENNPNLDFSKPIFSFADKTYSQKEIANHLMGTNIFEANMNIKVFIDRSLSAYIDNEIIKYENSMLESKYPNFKFIINEYHDGILLFEITDKEVWTKSVTDKEGLDKFYENNKSQYMWNNRVDYKVFAYKDNKTAKSLKKALIKGKNENKIIEKLNKKDSTAVILELDKRFEKESASNADNLLYGKNIPENIGGVSIEDNQETRELTVIYNVGNVQKELKDARGIITADYQNKLEKDWIERLHKSYNVIINEDVLKSLVK